MCELLRSATEGDGGREAEETEDGERVLELLDVEESEGEDATAAAEWLTSLGWWRAMCARMASSAWCSLSLCSRLCASRNRLPSVAVRTAMQRSAVALMRSERSSPASRLGSTEVTASMGSEFKEAGAGGPLDEAKAAGAHQQRWKEEAASSGAEGGDGSGEVAAAVGCCSVLAVLVYSMMGTRCTLLCPLLSTFSA